MKINRITSEPFFAAITIGRNHGYTDSQIAESELIKFIQRYQDKLIEEIHLYLSVCLSECKIVLSGQVELHYRLSFINYPKFPYPLEMLREEVEEFAKALMERFDQNRVVVEFSDETVMYEQSEEIDPRIGIKTNPQG
jgi:hypothetical protein